MPRRLRIAVSVSFALLAVAIAALCASSHWWQYSVGVGGRSVTSVNGYLLLNESFALNPAYRSLNLDWDILQITDGIIWCKSDMLIPMGTGTAIPQLLLALGAASVMVALWLPFYFSVRTLFIATTLVAVVLGLAAWSIP